MAHRFSRSEKGKWTAGPTPAKRPPLRIPATDNNDLIAANKLTLIGRVTNPVLQRTRAVIDFLPQVWNLEGRVEGRELGPEKFQMRFKSEEDLERVLLKGPYHFKRWMLLLQKWEPIISESFPSKIAFWIRIHDIPLHFWNEGTITAIGEDIGLMSDKVVEEAKVRVEVNGLQPLLMEMEIQLPSEEVISVEFEYIKIEKHCFTCFSLLHEEINCPHRARNAPHAKDRRLGITQRLALQRIEAEKRRHDDRRGYKRPAMEDRYNSARYDEQHQRRPYSDHRELAHRSIDSAASTQRRYVAKGSSHLQEPEGREVRTSAENDSRVLSSGIVIRQQDIPVDESPCPQINRAAVIRSSDSRLSHTPSPSNLRERLQYPLERDSSGEVSAPNSRERRSALERVAAPDLRSQISPRMGSSLNSDRLQEVDIQYDGIENQQHFSPVFHIGSSQQPRLPAALRLSDVNEAGPSNVKARAPNPPTSKSAGKRRITKAGNKTTTKRVTKTALPGVKLKNAMVTRSINPPRKKQCVDQNSIPCNKATTSDNSRNSSKRGGSDFRPPPPSLP